MLTDKQCYVNQSQPSRGNAKTVLANFFVLSIFGQFDYELESRLLKLENRFHAQHLLSRAVVKLTGHVMDARHVGIALVL
jgi:hypothetical protein